MTEFKNTIGSYTRLEFEPSFKKGWIVMKTYNDKSPHGSCIEIPFTAFKDMINQGLTLIGEDNGERK